MYIPSMKKKSQECACESNDDWICDFTKIFSACVAILSIGFILYLDSGAIGKEFFAISVQEAVVIAGLIGVVSVLVLLFTSIKPRLRGIFPFL
jgi:hypothetical protein